MKKKILSLNIAMLLLFSTISCSDLEETTSDDTVKNETISNESNSPEEIDEFFVINTFIEKYNNSSSFPMTDIREMDIQGEDYRTEFRLGAFKNSIGKKANVNESTIELVNYGIQENDSIRIYANVPTLDMAQEIYMTTIQIWDESLNENEIMEEFDAASIYLGETGYISGYVNEKYANGGVAGYEIMLDCTKLNFID